MRKCAMKSHFMYFQLRYLAITLDYKMPKKMHHIEQIMNRLSPIKQNE